MYYSEFSFRNYKGIKSASVRIPPPGANSIVTLIGLNESGKTTILEAISQFVSGDKDIKALYGTDSQVQGIETASGIDLAAFHEFVPKDKKANFSGSIEIEAILRIEQSDIDRISSHFSSEGLVLDKGTFPSDIVITRKIYYSDSVYTSKNGGNYWRLTFSYRTTAQRKFRTASPTQNRDIWLKCVLLIQPDLPQICYFPTFLFDFPKKIYLIPKDGEPPRNRIYRQVLQDILDSEGSGLNIESHIVDRLSSVGAEGDSWRDKYSKFVGTAPQDMVDSVLRRMAEHVGETVFRAWEKISEKHFDQKNISVQLGVDIENDGAPYLEFSLYDGRSKYSIEERSMGFKWFFSFLLFTQFRAKRLKSTSTLFLFDEPASNLHAKAQGRLLESFPKIAADQTSIIYSTHSLYLIDPKSLERSYIVENKAIDLEDEKDYLSARERTTDICAIPYRRFVGENPDRGSYYQPVTDRLKAVVSPLSLPNDVVITEGKTDFYFFNYYIRKYEIKDIGIFPSSGVDSYDVLISLALGLGKKFILLADDDKAGKDAVKRYKKDYLLNDRAFTYGDLVSEFSGFRLEDLFSDKVKSDASFGSAKSSLSKRDIALFFQEKSVSLDYDLDDETTMNMKKLFGSIRIVLPKSDI